MDSVMGTLGGVFESLFAVDFDGVDDYVDCGSSASLDNIWDGGATVGGWIYPRSDGESNAGRIFDKDAWAIFVINEQVGGVEVSLFHRTSGANAFWITTGDALPLDEWNFMTVTWSGVIGEVCEVRVNDVFVPQTLPSGSLTFDGLLDDLFIVNRVLTAAEVTEAYNNGNPYDLSGASFWADLIAWWKMGDGDTYPTLSDSKGSNDGTMTNMSADDIVGRQ
jgi:hypothetical protein